MAETLQAAVHRLLAYLPLKGLNSADFLVNDEWFVLLEVNPRPGASLDVFESEESPLVERHIRACRGQLASLPEQDEAIAARVVYATEDIASFPSFIWPSWAADRQRSGTRLKTGDPLCTVFARAPTAILARALSKDRAQIMLKTAHGRAS
jgi:predicted ATP-grasp superfamily ATP-dependent carboligase